MSTKMHTRHRRRRHRRNKSGRVVGARNRLVRFIGGVHFSAPLRPCGSSKCLEYSHTHKRTQAEQPMKKPRKLNMNFHRLFIRSVWWDRISQNSFEQTEFIAQLVFAACECVCLLPPPPGSITYSVRAHKSPALRTHTQSHNRDERCERIR